MNTAWTVILLVGISTIGFKAVGPIARGSREPSPRLSRMIYGLSPALLSALIVTQTLTVGQELVIDARALGVFSAAVLLILKRPIWLALLVAALLTAGVRWVI